MTLDDVAIDVRPPGYDSGMNIVFAKTRYTYDSYTDFWRLVELSGFDTCYVDEVRVDDPCVYITAPYNGEWKPHIRNHDNKHRNAYFIQWNLERPSGSGGVGQYALSNRRLMYDRLFDEIWVSDRRLAAETGFRFVVLGSDYGLAEVGIRINTEKRFDFCHMSYVVPRRQSVYSEFSEDKIAPNCWPPHRDEVLKLSKFALNIHQDTYPFQEPLRFALFAAYGLPILTETIYDSYPWSDEFMVYNPYDGIAGRLKQMLGNDYYRWATIGLRARDRMCNEFRFKDVVEHAVKESVG